MTDLRTKPINRWTIDDLNRIVDQEWVEDAQFELKQTLPLKKDARGWVASGRIHASERDGLAQEIVAFANSRGGLIIVGINESEESPKRAKSLSAPIPQIFELKERMARALSDAIDPPIRMLKIEVVEVQAGAGYILIDVPASNSAPHGFGSPPLCYVRERDESKPMSMREMQATFWESRTRFERIDALRAEKHEAWAAISRRRSAVAFRLSAIPDTEMPIPGLHRRLRSGDFFPTADQHAQRDAAPAAPWPFWNRDWNVDANCVRKPFNREGSPFERGYWEIDVSGAVSIIGEASEHDHTESEPMIWLAWMRATMADLLALARVVAAEHQYSESRWWIDGEAQSNPGAARIFYDRNRSVRVALNERRHFRPVPVIVSNNLEGVEHLDDALCSMFCVPCLLPGQSIELNYSANIADLKLS